MNNRSSLPPPTLNLSGPSHHPMKPQPTPLTYPTNINNSRISQNFPPIVLPPIKEGERYSNHHPHYESNQEPNQELPTFTSRRFSLPSISSFDQPLPRTTCTPMGIRKLSLPDASFQGLSHDLSQGFHQTESGMHACQFPGCYWSFKRGEHLKRHMSVHTRERPYLCSYPGCNRSFSRSDNLNVHYRTHLDSQSHHTEETYTHPYQGHPSPLEVDDSSQFKRPRLDRPFSYGERREFHHQSNESTPFSKGSHLTSILPQKDSHKLVTLPSINDLTSRREEKSTATPESNYPYYHPDPNSHFDSRYTKSYRPQNPLEQLANVATTTPSLVTNLHPYTRPDPTTHQPPNSKLIWTDLDDEGRPIKYYVCQYKGCHMKFKRSEHLTRHRLVHTMERPFSCTHPGCNKAFSRADNLRQHARIHNRPNGPHHLPPRHPPYHPHRLTTATSTTYTSNSRELTAPHPFPRQV